uniref:Uncharacterized protein n=1 Tax=Kalanchoe fedtschenkoi TaxID=63787 RepID=A0A7N0TDV0_KALFE
MGGVAWTEEEDHLLKKCVEQYGEGKWHRVPLLAGLNRCRKSCRLRWLNYLRPNIRRGTFTDEEVLLIIKLHNNLGNRWSLIASRLPGRTANDVKNYWNCHLSKKLNKVHNKDDPTISPVTTSNQQVGRFTAHHQFQTLTSISGSSSTGPHEEQTSMIHLEDMYSLELKQVGSNWKQIVCGGEEEDGQNEVNKFAPEFEYEDTKIKAGGEIRSMDNNWGCWEDLIFDMDL